MDPFNPNNSYTWLPKLVLSLCVFVVFLLAAVIYYANTGSINALQNRLNTLEKNIPKIEESFAQKDKDQYTNTSHWNWIRKKREDSIVEAVKVINENAITDKKQQDSIVEALKTTTETAKSIPKTYPSKKEVDEKIKTAIEARWGKPIKK